MVSALKDKECEVSECLAIFTYELTKSEKAFKEQGITLHTLTDFTTLIDVAIEEGKISSEHREIVLSWKDSPEDWGR